MLFPDECQAQSATVFTHWYDRYLILVAAKIATHDNEPDQLLSGQLLSGQLLPD